MCTLTRLGYQELQVNISFSIFSHWSAAKSIRTHSLVKVVHSHKSDVLPSYLCDDNGNDGVADSLYDSYGTMVTSVFPAPSNVTVTPLAFTKYSISFSK
jgi:hypothetical protein